MDLLNLLASLAEDPRQPIGWILMATGLGGLYRDWTIRQLVAACQRWPTVEGVILDSTIEFDKDVWFGGEPGNYSPGVFSPTIRYRYTVKGREFIGDQVAPGGIVHTSSKAGAIRWTQRFPPGARVRVHYNPRSPAEAYLLAEYMAGFWGRGIPLLFIAIGFGLASEWIGASHLGIE